MYRMDSVQEKKKKRKVVAKKRSRILQLIQSREEENNKCGVALKQCGSKIDVINVAAVARQQV